MTGPGGVPVKGSRYAPNKRRFRRRFFPHPARPGQDDGKTGDSSAGPASDGEGQNGAQPQRRRQRRRPETQSQTEVRGSVYPCFVMFLIKMHTLYIIMVKEVLGW